jgi:hypothetical protein
VVAALTGYFYEKDNATVGNIIKEVCLGTEAESWIKNIVGVFIACSLYSLNNSANMTLTGCL